MHECLTTKEGAISYLPQRFRQPHSLELGAELEDSFLTTPTIMFSRAQVHNAICNNSRCDCFIMFKEITSVLSAVPGVPNSLRGKQA